MAFELLLELPCMQDRLMDIKQVQARGGKESRSRIKQAISGECGPMPGMAVKFRSYLELIQAATGVPFSTW